MKTLLIPSVCVMILMACNDQSRPVTNAGPKTEADSLQIVIDKGHIDGMGKMGKLTRLSQRAQAIVDSLGPSGAKTPYGMQVSSVLARLKYAEFAMDKWMGEYKEDSLASDLRAHTGYLQTENEKVTKMVDSIHASIAAADSLLR